MEAGSAPAESRRSASSRRPRPASSSTRVPSDSTSVAFPALPDPRTRKRSFDPRRDAIIAAPQRTAPSLSGSGLKQPTFTVGGGPQDGAAISCGPSGFALLGSGPEASLALTATNVAPQHAKV